MFPLQVAIEPIVNWGEVGAAAINSVGVLLAVQVIVYFLPKLRAKFPWAIPIIAVVAGPALGKLTELLFGILGHPVDLGPILAALTGTAAVTMHQIGKQASRGG
jgi:hypothetical protein